MIVFEPEIHVAHGEQRVTIGTDIFLFAEALTLTFRKGKKKTLSIVYFQKSSAPHLEQMPSTPETQQHPAVVCLKDQRAFPVTTGNRADRLVSWW